MTAFLSEPPPSSSQARAPKAHVYRCFDEGGKLLYVGASLALFGRLGAHQSRSPWFDEVRSIAIEPFYTREDALAAEAAAIATERPYYNLFLPGAASDKGRLALGKLNFLRISRAKGPAVLHDGGGLYLRVSRTGGKSWKFRYQKNGKRHDIGLGGFSRVSLAEARRLADVMRRRQGA